MVEVDIPNLISTYSQIARRIMLKYLEPNSCIAATKVTCDCLHRLGFEPQPVATKFGLLLPEENVMYASGLNDVELSKAAAVKNAWEGGWNGHLITRVDCLLVDSAFDQAKAAVGKSLASLESGIYVFPITTELPHFHVMYKAVLSDGRNVEIMYATTGDGSFRDTEAWNDENLVNIADEIMSAMLRVA